MAGSMARPAFGGQGKRLSFHGYFPFERTFFPFLQIAYHAEPCGMLRLLEVEGIVVGLDRFETEYFDKRSRFFMEVQTRLNNFGIIENHQAVCRQIVGQGSEYVFGNFAVAIQQ